jgi:SpoU rRNA methylase family enzyme
VLVFWGGLLSLLAWLASRSRPRTAWRRVARVAAMLALLTFVVAGIAAMSLQPGLGDALEVALAVSAALFAVAALARAIDVSRPA